MWTKNKLWKLRQEIVLGSLFTRDYDNSFGVNERDCQDFFDGYLEWLEERMNKDGTLDDDFWDGTSDDSFWDALDEYDNPENLYRWYMMLEDDLPVIED